MEQEHPLQSSAGWEFSQPEIGYATQYTATELETRSKSVKTLKVSNTCREGVIHDTRRALQAVLTRLEPDPRRKWDTPQQATMVGEVDLSKGRKTTELIMGWCNGTLGNHGKEGVEHFLKMCDVIAGPVCVLLGTQRPEGDWWKTDPAKASRSWKNRDYPAVHWHGTDNWFLAHPAAMAIALGLYRQCFLLCRTTLWKDILKLVSEDEIEEVMSSGRQALALRILKRTRPFIEVPPASNSSDFNYPFPSGFWKRLLCLQRAIRRHGYEKSFDQTFAEGWNLVHTGKNLSGLYSHWGTQDKLTGAHHKLLELGAVRTRIRRQSGGQQVEAGARERRR